MLVHLGRYMAPLSRSQPSVSAPINDLLLVPYYDSLGNRRKARATQFNAAAVTAGFDSSGVSDMSTDGCYLTKSLATAAGGSNYLIDDDDPEAPVRSALYTSVYGAISAGNVEAMNVAEVFGGTNDANASSGVTKEHYKTYFKVLGQFIRADFPNVQKIFLNILHRNLDESASDANYQAIKEAQFEVIAEVSYIERGIELYDRDIDTSPDNVHPAYTEYEGEISRRAAVLMARTFGKTSAAGAYGPSVTAASFDGRVILNCAHDAGTDFATIPSGAENCFGFDIGGTVYKPSGVSKLDETTLELKFDNKGLIVGTLNNAMIGYGAMKGLSRTTPEVVKDNATNPMPLRQRVIVPTQDNPIWQTTGLVTALDPETVARTLSGSDVTAITDNVGRGYGSAAGRYPHYADGFLTAPDSATHMVSGSNFTASASGFGGIVLDVPETIATEESIFGFGVSSAGSVRAMLRLRTDGTIRWSRNNTDGYELISSTDWRGEKVIILWNFKSASEADFYVNSMTPHSFDPFDAMASQNRIWLFAERTTYNSLSGLGIGDVFHKNDAHDPDNDPAILNYMQFLSGKYSIPF